MIAHQGKILRQSHQFCARFNRFRDQLVGFQQVSADIGTRCHLYGRTSTHIALSLIYNHSATEYNGTQMNMIIAEYSMKILFNLNHPRSIFLTAA